jgi:hypothetical protein
LGLLKEKDSYQTVSRGVRLQVKLGANFRTMEFGEGARVLDTVGRYRDPSARKKRGPQDDRNEDDREVGFCFIGYT